MFITEIDEEHANEKRINALKPMNCPCHVQVFNQGLKSYRDLPLRLAEFGSCHRYEAHGALHGLMRVRGFTQDDAHIFCTEDQIEAECAAFIDLCHASIAMRASQPSTSSSPPARCARRLGRGLGQGRGRAGKAAMQSVRNDYEVDPGEGAFYGPKLDFKLTDAIGREWQCGTFQVDFNLPERLDASYIGAGWRKHRPVMLHRAILGSFERFIGILIENYAGKLPFWLAPRQVVVASIVSEADDFVAEAVAALRAAGLRAEADIRNEKINYKVREHSVGKVPVILAGAAQRVGRAARGRARPVPHGRNGQCDLFRVWASLRRRRHRDTGMLGKAAPQHHEIAHDPVAKGEFVDPLAKLIDDPRNVRSQHRAPWSEKPPSEPRIKRGADQVFPVGQVHRAGQNPDPDLTLARFGRRNIRKTQMFRSAISVLNHRFHS
jgi:hypothetical protein